MLIWGLKFGVGETLGGLKFETPNVPICGLKFGVDEITWGLKFEVKNVRQ